MLRASSARSARTLTRALRSARRREAGRTTRLRLDTLEAREQPGSVLSGTVAGQMIDPLAAMTLAVGEAALLGPNAEAPVMSTAAPVAAPADSMLFAPSPSESPPADRLADRRETGGDPSPSTGVTVASDSIDPADLSVTDPSLFDLRPIPPGSTEGSGGSGAGSIEAVPSAFAGQSTADGPAAFAGPDTEGGGADESLAGSSGTRSVPAGGAGSAGEGQAAVTATGSGRGADTFVTPPNDAPVLEGPAPTAAPAVAAATTTNPIFAVGTDAGVTGQVNVYDAQTLTLKFTLSPYAGSFKGGVRVAVADVTGDGQADVVTGQGGGGSNQVRVFDGDTGKALKGTLGGFSPYTSAQASGVWVAAGDVTGDGKADLVVGTDGNTSPQVKIYSGANGSLVRAQDVSSLGLVGGARVAAGDVNGDGKADVLVGGRNGASHVAAYDSNGKLLYDYLPGAAGDRAGVNVAAGDFDGDGYTDVFTGPAGAGLVRVFGGYDTASAWNLEAFAAFSGGVRVGAADADADGGLDVLAAQGPGGGEVRGYAAADGAQLFALRPFGAAYAGGLFVAGDSRPVPQEGGGVGILSGPPVVSVQSDGDVTEGGKTSFTFTRSDSSGASTLMFTVGGTANHGTDYGALPTSITFPGNDLSYTMDVVVSGTPYQDSLIEGDETVVITLNDPVAPPPPYPPPYILGTKQAALTIRDDDGPTDIPSYTYPLGGPCTAGDPGFEAVGVGSGEEIDPSFIGSDGGGPEGDPGFWSPGCVQNADGTIFLTCVCAPTGAGFGQPWGMGWAWTNQGGNPAPGFAGNGVVLKEVPYLKTDGTDVVVPRGTGAEYFDGSGGTYTPRHMSLSTLTENTTNKEFTLTTSGGAKLVFNNFDASLPTYQKGQIKSVTDPDGNTTTVTSRTTDGKPADVQRSATVGGVTTTESYQYAYIASGTNAGKLESVTLRRQVGAGSWTTVRKMEFAFHDGTGSGGTAGDLNTAVEKDGAGNVLSTSWYRYYTSSSSTGYPGALKYAVTGASYERAKAWGAAQNPSLTVDQMTDAQIAPFADNAYEWNALHAVTKHTQQGNGCTSCFGGLQTSTFSYSTSPFAPGYNSWQRKTVETRADGNTLSVYSNFAGQPVLKVYKDVTTGQEWATYFQRDTQGRLTLEALPSAVSGYDATKADLVNNQSGNYQYLRDTQGLVRTATYNTSTSPSISETTTGGVAGYLSQTAVRRGESGTSVLQGTTDYFKRTAGGATVYPVASQTQYRNTNGTGGQTTSFAYTFYSGAIQPQQTTTTLPAVTTGQNGSGMADSSTVVENDRGQVIWQKDQAGFLTYVEYNAATGGVTKVIRDVDTTQTSTFAELPSGWATPTGGGLHLTTSYELDDQGRPTKTTSPNGNIIYTVYNDAAHEVRVYPGWDSTNNVPTGPTQVYRDDRARGYRETLSMSATPHLTNGRPDGTEAVSGIQSLSREVLNDAGQVVFQDQYFDLTGVTYSQSSVTLGTAGTNYLRTQLSYGKFGQLERTLTPSGTIHRTVFDGRVRPVSTWVGTDDTPTSGFWSPTNTAGTDLVKVSESVYDDTDGDGDGDVGDGNRSHALAYPTTSAADTRRTDFAYDWRDRQVALKAGVETSESTSVNRPITYSELDNLGEVIASEMYDGDGLSITADSNSDGVPDRPSSSALRAKSTADFDELGRVYQSKTFSVDPSNGTVSTNALVSKQWYNSRGLVMKSSAPGGLVTKCEFDGAGRKAKCYVTDGGGDAGYSDADDVASDNVLGQTELTYDANGNTIFVVARERFHDETGTGALGTPSTGVKARVSYSARYFDKADRLTVAVDVGTNGGSAYTRPGTVPSRSDTVLVTSSAFNSAGWVESVTDPKGLVNKTFYDLAGRTTKTVANYVNGTVSDSDDKTVEYTYDASGGVKTLKALLTGGGYQKTEWVYGITSPIVSNDVLKEMRYPDAASGDPSSSEKDAFTYNQLGQQLTKTDRNGNVHTYSLDILGRVIADTVTTLGSGVDGSVRRLETGYDGQGNPFKITSYDAISGGNVLNEVQREYNGLGQLTKEYQAVSGAVNTSTTPNVQYGYSFSGSGSMNHSRLTSITYPNARALTYIYASGLSDNISRLSSISDGATTLESYEYLGSGTVVKRAHAQPGVDLTYIKLTGESDGSAGDKYIGLDRFGRVVDQRWTTSGGTAKDRWAYGHDRDSNRLYKENLVEGTRSELYAYDGLNQVTSMQRGTLNGTKDGLTGSASRSQSWDFDALGNFDSQTTDGTGQTRSHNKQNEITSVQNATTPTYDASGNLTKDETGRTYKYDAWDRLAEVRDSGNNLLATHRYDGLNRRMRETRGSTTTDLYYSSGWQVLEERVGSAVQSSYAWSPVYVDALIARDRDADGNAGNGLEERLYAAQDANFNVTAVFDTSGTVQERAAYDAFGLPTYLTGSWGSRSGSSYAWTYLHQGLRYDAAAGNYSARQRDYSPTLGRWLQRDPIGFAGGDVNVYRYVDDSPITGLDPTGLRTPYTYSYLIQLARGENPLGHFSILAAVVATMSCPLSKEEQDALDSIRYSLNEIVSYAALVTINAKIMECLGLSPVFPGLGGPVGIGLGTAVCFQLLNRTNSLIAQLGAKSYKEREQAERDLAALLSSSITLCGGTTACAVVAALEKAKKDPDAEIGRRATGLLSRYPFNIVAARCANNPQPGERKC